MELISVSPVIVVLMWILIIAMVVATVYAFVKAKTRSFRFQIILFVTMCFAFAHARAQYFVDGVLKSAGDPNDNILTISYLTGALICLIGIIAIEVKRMKG